jgi:hypothetical protein
MKAGFAMLKNKLGRPAIYAINSILSGAPVGLWHVTIGNPRNPIFSMGNLILTNAQISHSGPLGIDDFPTELKVKVTLTHGQPRDVSGIENMYTCGQGDILLPLNGRKPSDYYDLHKGSTSNFSRGETEERYNQEMIRTVWRHLGR